MKDSRRGLEVWKNSFSLKERLLLLSIFFLSTEDGDSLEQMHDLHDASDYVWNERHVLTPRELLGKIGELANKNSKRNVPFSEYALYLRGH